MERAVQQLLDSVDELASLPSIYGRVSKLLDDPDSTIRALADVISQDPGLSLKLLRIANSAFYGRTKDVDTIEQALNVIGMQRVGDIVLGTTAMETFNGIPNELVSMEDFWMHSLYCAIAARLLARKINNSASESIFIAALLHDIGQLLLFHVRPEESRQVLLLTIEDISEPDMVEAEQRVLGYDHSQIGAALAQQWQLPDMLTAAIRYHHTPEKERVFQQEVALVHIGNILAYMAELDEITEDDIGRIHSCAWSATGLDAEIIPEFMQQTREQFDEVKGLFLS
jgi:putative nucleotidyltransferase with HDIG domain